MEGELNTSLDKNLIFLIRYLTKTYYMEKVFTTEYLNDKIMDQLSPYDLNNLRACSLTLQDSISRYSNERWSTLSPPSPLIMYTI